jgi:hypothetical protein
MIYLTLHLNLIIIKIYNNNNKIHKIDRKKEENLKIDQKILKKISAEGQNILREKYIIINIDKYNRSSMK